jgi:hypothetical protein
MEHSVTKRQVEASPVDAVDVDRRADLRFRTIYRVAKVATGCDLGLWRVRNISDRGMMLTTSVEVAAGEHLWIALSDTATIEGKVIWCDAGRCGIAFDAPIDSAALLSALAAEQRGPDYRAPRLPVDSRALAYDETGIHPVKICDLSLSGVGIMHHCSFRPGTRVKLRFENGLERSGIVRWADHHHAGLALMEPFACEELESAGRLQKGL